MTQQVMLRKTKGAAYQPVTQLKFVLVMGLGPIQAAGPIYDELPDLEGAEVRVAVENLYLPFQFENP